VKRRIHESVLPVQAAIGCAEQERLAPVPGGMIADSEMIANSEPKIARAPDLPDALR
jgi:hypothetical protein